jgi:hypothetical protein
MTRFFLLVSALFAIAACSGVGRGTPPIDASQDSAQRAHAAGSSIVLDAASKGPTVSADIYGASLDTWYQFWNPFVNPSLRDTGIHLVRFPGGSESDAYHWENGGTLCANMGYITPGATFDRLMTSTARPLQLDISITLNYGSNPTCNGGGLPSEAAAWVAYAKRAGYNVPYWTVGNEVYGSWEYDLHSSPHDANAYATAFRSGYYPLVKKANPNAQLGVVGDFDQPKAAAWNRVVFRNSGPFDFVEIHYYPQYDTDSDSFLLGQAVDKFEKELAGLRTEMTADGVKPSVPLYLGEFNNDAGNEGKQSVSIVNGLYLGQMLGTLMNAGVPRATWWVAYGSCDQSGDYSSSLYGWQNFGSEALFSDGLPDSYEGCGSTPAIPGGTPFPPARVMALFHATVPPGSTVRTVRVPSSLHSSIRAYAFAVGSGYALVMFNNTLTAAPVTATVRNGSGAYTAKLWTYGKSQYDESKNNQWVGPSSTSLGSVSSSVPLTLQPYSMTVLQLTR